MATWQELSEDNLAAAKELLQKGRTRSSISRAYYAAYCAVTAKLVQKKASFARGWNNPAHEQVLRMIEDNLRLTIANRRQLARAMHNLRVTREKADYRPDASFDGNDAIDGIRYAEQVIRIVEEIQ